MHYQTKLNAQTEKLAQFVKKHEIDFATFKRSSFKQILSEDHSCFFRMNSSRRSLLLSFSTRKKLSNLSSNERSSNVRTASTNYVQLRYDDEFMATTILNLTKFQYMYVSNDYFAT